MRPVRSGASRWYARPLLSATIWPVQFGHPVLWKKSQAKLPLCPVAALAHRVRLEEGRGNFLCLRKRVMAGGQNECDHWDASPRKRFGKDRCRSVLPPPEIRRCSAVVHLHFGWHLATE